MSVPLFTSKSGFSLVEVVLALGLAAFVLVSITGMLSIGLTGVNDSEMKLTAANVATEILQERLAAPTNTLAGNPITNLVPANLPTSSAAAISNTATVGTGGDVVPTGQGRFLVTSWVWRDTHTVSDTNTSLVRIHLIISWPPGASATNALNQYDVMTSVLAGQ